MGWRKNFSPPALLCVSGEAAESGCGLYGCDRSLGLPGESCNTATEGCHDGGRSQLRPAHTHYQVVVASVWGLDPVRQRAPLLFAVVESSSVSALIKNKVHREPTVYSIDGLIR